jgi:hypothetical protein
VPSQVNVRPPAVQEKAATGLETGVGVGSGIGVGVCPGVGFEVGTGVGPGVALGFDVGRVVGLGVRVGEAVVTGFGVGAAPPVATGTAVDAVVATGLAGDGEVDILVGPLGPAPDGDPGNAGSVVGSVVSSARVMPSTPPLGRGPAPGQLATATNATTANAVSTTPASRTSRRQEGALPSWYRAWGRKPGPQALRRLRSWLDRHHGPAERPGRPEASPLTDIDAALVGRPASRRRTNIPTER